MIILVFKSNGSPKAFNTMDHFHFVEQCCDDQKGERCQLIPNHFDLISWGKLIFADYEVAKCLIWDVGLVLVFSLLAQCPSMPSWADPSSLSYHQSRHSVLHPLHLPFYFPCFQMLEAFLGCLWQHGREKSKGKNTWPLSCIIPSFTVLVSTWSLIVPTSYPPHLVGELWQIQIRHDEP